MDNMKYSIKRQMILDTYARRDRQKKEEEEYIIFLVYYFIILFIIYSQLNYISKNYYIKWNNGK